MLTLDWETVGPARTWKGRYDANFERAWTTGDRRTAGDHRVLVRIRRNFYDFQSSATIVVWSPALKQWSALREIPYPLMDSLVVSASKELDNTGDIPQAFLDDEATLLALAEEVLV